MKRARGESGSISAGLAVESLQRSMAERKMSADTYKFFYYMPSEAIISELLIYFSVRVDDDISAKDVA